MPIKLQRTDRDKSGNIALIAYSERDLVGLFVFNNNGQVITVIAKNNNQIEVGTLQNDENTLSTFVAVGSQKVYVRHNTTEDLEAIEKIPANLGKGFLVTLDANLNAQPRNAIIPHGYDFSVIAQSRGLSGIIAKQGLRDGQYIASYYTGIDVILANSTSLSEDKSYYEIKGAHSEISSNVYNFYKTQINIFPTHPDVSYDDNQYIATSSTLVRGDALAQYNGLIPSPSTTASKSRHAPKTTGSHSTPSSNREISTSPTTYSAQRPIGSQSASNAITSSKTFSDSNTVTASRAPDFVKAQAAANNLSFLSLTGIIAAGSALSVGIAAFYYEYLKRPRQQQIDGGENGAEEMQPAVALHITAAEQPQTHFATQNPLQIRQPAQPDTYVYPNEIASVQNWIDITRQHLPTAPSPSPTLDAEPLQAQRLEGQTLGDDASR